VDVECEHKHRGRKEQIRDTDAREENHAWCAGKGLETAVEREEAGGTRIYL
jgi:hypothetical protein